MKNWVLLLSAIVMCGLIGLEASAQIPTAVTYQGFLETAGQPVDGSVAMTVRLYAQAAGGVASWVGTFPTVSVTRGVYTIALNPAGLVFDKPYYLETEINGSVSATRTALTSAPYALGPWTPDNSGNGTISYSGKVGIGTGSVPSARLELLGDWNVAMPALRLVGNKPTLEFDGNVLSGNKQWLMHLGSNGPGNLEFRDVALNSVPVMSLSPASSTAARMQIYGQRGIETVGYQPYFTLTDANSGYTETRIQNAGGVMNFETHQDIVGGLPPSMELSSLANTSKLTLRSQDGLNTVGYEPFLTLTDANAGYARSRVQGINGDLTFFPNSFIGGSAAMILKNTSGNVGIGTSTPSARLEVIGRTRTGSLEITGGSDLAEPFETSIEAFLEPGTVVVIDANHPGMLCTSSTPYDQKVAGIVSGAGGVNPGLTLSQVGILEGKNSVAIAGRVYCKAEALSGPINPGDLLTTSSIPGHAMKASDPERSLGTVIGKAMTSLPEGKGLVLVLVNLQ